MADIVLFGASHAAEAATAYLERHSEHRIVGYTVDASYCTSDRAFGKPLVPWEKLHEVFAPDRVRLLGPFSYQRLNQFRRDRYLEGKARGYSYITFIHPSALVYTDDIGENCFILGQNVIEARVHVGNNVVMWGSCYIAHHTVIGDHCFFSAQVGITGDTVIGELCFFGGQVGIGKNVTIGKSCFFGETVNVVREDVPDHSVYIAKSTPRSKIPSTRLVKLL